MGTKKTVKKKGRTTKEKVVIQEQVKAKDRTVPTSGLMNSQLQDAKRLQETIPLLADILQEHLIEVAQNTKAGKLESVMGSIKCGCGSYGYHPTYRYCLVGNAIMDLNVEYFYCSQCKKQITPEEVKKWAEDLGVDVK